MNAMIFAPATPINSALPSAPVRAELSWAFTLPFLLYLLLSPLYLLPSGLPQIADGILALGMALYFAHMAMRSQGRMQAVFLLALAFAGYTVLINLINYQFLPDRRFLLSCLYYPFNALVFMYVAGILMRDPGTLRQRAIWFIGAAIIWEVLWALFVPQSHWREHGSFNNPNQLAYWSLLSATMIVMLRRDDVLRWPELIMIGALAVVQMMALSKAGLITFGLFSALLFISPLITHKMRIFILGAAAVLGLALMLSAAAWDHLSYLGDAIDRLKNIGEEADDSLAARGYARLFEFPEYVLLGAGEGGFSRFDIHAKELHSGLATILFSYGIMGAFLFAALLYRIFARQPLYILMFLLPVILFGASGQNIRFSDFWVYLAITYAGLFFTPPAKQAQSHVPAAA